MVICPVCGATIRRDAPKFCTQCGVHLASVVVEQPTPIVEEVVEEVVAEQVPVIEETPVVEEQPTPIAQEVVEEVVAVETAPIVEEVVAQPVVEETPVVEEVAPTIAQPVEEVSDNAQSSPEMQKAEDFLAKLINYDKSIATYIEDHSNANREGFYQAFKELKAAADSLDYEWKEPIDLDWRTIEASIDGLRMTSNKFVKFASMGSSGFAEKNTLVTIKNATTSAISKFKRVIASKSAPAGAEATIVTPVAQAVAPSALSPEKKAAAEKFLEGWIKYDNAIGTYMEDHSNANREGFYQAFKELKAIADVTDYEIKEPIDLDWRTIEASIDGLRMTSNKFVKFASMGSSGFAEKNTLVTIKNATTSAISKLKRFINGQAVQTMGAPAMATPVASTPAELSPEKKAAAEKFLEGWIKYDNAIGTYMEDHSNENREGFYQAFKELKAIADVTDYEIKEPIDLDWRTIEASIDGLRMTSNKFVKFASMGSSGFAEKNTLVTIKNATTAAVSKLKRFINGQAVQTMGAPAMATPVASTPAELSPEKKVAIEKFLEGWIKYDNAIGTYMEDHSNANREGFYQAFKELKAIADVTDYEIKEPIDLDWRTIEASIDGLRMTSNKFVKFASMGSSGFAEKNTLVTIKNATTAAVSKLKRMLEGKAVQTMGAPAMASPVVASIDASPEKRALAEDFLAKLINYDKSIATYIEDHSNANREGFYQAFKELKAAADSLDYEWKEPIDLDWRTIEASIDGLRMTSNKFVKFASMGSSGFAEKNTLVTIKNATTSAISKFKRLLNA